MTSLVFGIFIHGKKINQNSLLFHICESLYRDGCNVAGYFAWSSMDNYEFSSGYTIRFGMNYVNFTNPADRREKDSAKWYSKFNAN